MSKYINTDELRTEFWTPNDKEYFYEDICKILDDMPFADVVEVEHGHWELDGTCSVCRKHTLQSYGNFCCYCGADMREE